MYETQPTPQALNGRAKDLPARLALKSVDPAVLLAAKQISQASRQASRWTGVSIQFIAASLHYASVSLSGMHPAVWASFNFNHPLIMSFDKAERQGFITICDGYIHATQKLVDALLQTG